MYSTCTVHACTPYVCIILGLVCQELSQAQAQVVELSSLLQISAHPSHFLLSHDHTTLPRASPSVQLNLQDSTKPGLWAESGPEDGLDNDLNNECNDCYNAVVT